MTKFVHIVQVHPVENGIVQTHKVKYEQEFDFEAEAKCWIETFNHLRDDVVAVYLGCVNDETGELV